MAIVVVNKDYKKALAGLSINGFQPTPSRCFDAATIMFRVDFQRRCDMGFITTHRRTAI
jgi:hypothetical protein